MGNFSNNQYQFAVPYPADFSVLSPGSQLLYPLSIPASASFAFMNPDSAASDAVEYEFPDFEVRVYSADGNASLEDWLRPTGFLEGMLPPEPFQTNYVSGIMVCQSSMMAPGCTYFVKGNGWNYQLTSATLEGEAMFNAFTLLP